MTEHSTGNGEARQGVAVLNQRVVDCQARCTEHRAGNERDHDALFGRMRDVEAELAGLKARIAIWGGGAVFGATVVAQIVIRLLPK